uniref:protein-serine/threonine phosphatase n=1 Tax=Anopheles minimus TaxID=112268 RepID=A0A182VSP1_9DIPT
MFFMLCYINRSECQKFRTSQRTVALMLGSNEHLRTSCEDQVRATNNTAACITVSVSDSSSADSVLNDETANRYAAGAVESGESKVEGRTASRPTSSCSSGSSSSSTDIQQHLQSMFCLLRPEETLKMAVKLESLRTGRTRYLVVVSRTVTSKRHNTGTLYLSGNGSVSSSNGNISSWPLSATPVTTTTTTAPTTAQHFGRTCSALSSTVTAVNMRHGSCTSETFAGIDTFLPSMDNCVLNVGTINSGRLPDGHVPCRSDQCDSKTNSRLINSTTTGEMAPSSANIVGEPSATPGREESTLSDKGDCPHESVSAFIQGELHPQQYQNQHSNSNSAITVEGGKKIEESCLLGIDCNERTTVGLVLKVLADTSIRLDGDGGFSVSSCGKQHIFKPVSVQAMWSALQTLHKASFKAREHNFFAGGPSHDWVSYYEAHIDSDRSCLNEWNAMDSLESRRPPSPGSIRSKPTEREETESVIRSKLKEVMMSVDLDDVTSKFIRGRLEELLDMDLGEYKPFIDAEMLVILGQMDAPTEIFDHVYLGSEWNASNLEELQRNGVHHILNVTREIDNFFPGLFHYCNVRVYDDEKTDLLRHWDNTFKFISRAKMEGSKVLVHCKMGISRSASVVIAYAMKANGWNFEHALRHVKEKRNCIKPNKNFLMQLETYQGMLDAMKNKEKLQRSKSETNLKLAGAKEGRSLPGSEPTPLIQALNGAGGKKQPANGVLVSTVGKASHNVEAEVDATSASGAEIIEFTGVPEGSDEGDAGPGRGRARTRLAKLQTTHPHNVKQHELSVGSQQVQPEQQMSLSANPSVHSRHSKIMTNLFLPAAANKMFNPCEGKICTRGSGALKRHKSLSPDSLNTRWSGNYDFDASLLAYAEQSFTATARASRTRTMLELDNQAEPYVVAGPVGGGRRKQQSYSLEHLHGGALEMRSPCTETKTIRMPCGNGQNYSVSPNQIVHLQDKLSANEVRPTVSSSLATTATASSPTTTRTERFPKKLFSSSSSCSSGGTNEQGSSGASFQSLTAIVPSTVPSSSSTLGGSTVKTIVNELECNSSSNIPVAPPPLLTDPGTILSTVVPIPIASVAAEAAAVAVASAIREATRKEFPESKDVNATSLQVSLDAKGDNRTNNPEQWDPGETDDRGEPICWTSSAQIIQQCPTTGLTEPTPVEGANNSGEHCEGPVETESGSCAASKSTREGIMRQCSWSSCDSGCTGTDEVRTGSYIQRRLTAPGQPCVVNSSSSSAPVIEERDEIPWHPGTVKRTKKRIEQRSTNVVGGTMKWSTPLTASTLSTTSASVEKLAAVTEDIAPAGSSNAQPTDQQQSQKNPQEEMGLVQVRERQGMVSSSYARLSASAPDSYNLYAESANRLESIGTNVISDTLPAKRQFKLNHQHSFAGTTGDTLSQTGEPSSYCLRVCFRGGTADRHHQQELGDGVEEDTFNAGKVRNLKMSFEAKSNDRRQGPKKVRSLPSSPVAVHVSMGGSQTKQTSAQPIGPTIAATTSAFATPSSSAISTSSSLLPGTVSEPGTTKHVNQIITPPEDVTVRDLVDRYEEQGPRIRAAGSNSLSRTQRPRSVFEPLKQSAGGKPFAPAASLMSHSTTQWRVDESMRPPVPPLMRAQVIPQHSGSGGGCTVPYNNNSTGPNGANYTVQASRVQSSGPGGHTNSNNVRNNNTRLTLQSGGAGDGGLPMGTVGGKRPQQHGRTHPLAKINPSAKHHHHHLHVHHHHHLVHHQYNVGQLQQHRHIGTAPGSGVSSTTGPSATVTANAYNTM